MSAVLGVDGWRGGWVAAIVDDRHGVSWQVFDVASDITATAATVVAIDIPIGLLDAGSRECDLAARALLPGAASSVFPAPLRPVLDCPDYPAALATLRDRGLPLMSAQAFGITGKVREVDQLLRQDPAAAATFVEVHPELAFRRLAGRDMLARKKSAAGVAERLSALGAWLPDVVASLEQVPNGVPVDDAVDALACAYTAQEQLRGRTQTLGGDLDRYGLPMRIVMPLDGVTDATRRRRLRPNP